MKTIIKHKLSPKQFLIMIVIMLVSVFTYFYVSGFFKTQVPFIDIVSLSPEQTIAESDHWAFCIPEKEERTPYFIYDGVLNPSPQVMGSSYTVRADQSETEVRDIIDYNAAISLSGIIYYTEQDSAEVQSEMVNEALWDDSHFYVGEQRWYLKGYEDKRIVRLSLRIQWKEGTDKLLENISSGDLTEAEMKQAQDWINMED